MSSVEANQRSRGVSSFYGAVCLATAITLAGCSNGGGVGQFLVDPSLYDVYHCNELATQWTALNKREAELRANMDRAGQTAGGKVIGVMAYGSDYQAVLTQKKMVQRQAAEKKCELSQTYQSDQMVR